METAVEKTSSVTEQVAKAILKAFETSEYLNIADFRLAAKGRDSQTLDAAIEHLIENEYMVDLDADDYDVETGGAETIYARIVPIGNHQE
jgi:predicted negative regulator of RcsB-dependent stress response